MGDQDISEQIRQFIYTHISSVAQLEILLLLHTDPNQSWSAADIARELRIEALGAREQIAGLCNSGLVRQEPPDSDSYRFAPKSPELAAATVGLAQAYLVRRVTIIGLIFNKPSEKIRVFSEAFRFRKDPPNG